MAVYFTYNEGVEAKRLHLGNLVHDYKHPNELEPYIEKAYTDLSEETPDWAQVGSLENYAMTLGRAPSQEHDLEDDDDAASDSQVYRVVAAAKTTRAEIKDPVEFFAKHTLASEEAKKWFSSHLAAAAKIDGKKAKAQPQVWMLTGLLLMQHATWTRLSSKDKRFVAGERAPFIPAGVSAIRRSSVSDAVKPTFGYVDKDEDKHIPGGHIIHETGKYPGRRAWAAQWTKIDIDITSSKQAGPHDIVLKSPPGIAHLTLREDVTAKNREDSDSESDEEHDDAYWDAFLDAIED